MRTFLLPAAGFFRVPTYTDVMLDGHLERQYSSKRCQTSEPVSIYLMCACRACLRFQGFARGKVTVLFLLSCHSVRLPIDDEARNDDDETLDSSVAVGESSWAG